MADSPGKRLAEARKAEGLSIDDAAHATRMRPDKIIALENDDYSRFPGPAYARGFLQIYSRFLGVDVSDHLRALDTGHKVNVGEYEYLNHAPEPTPMRVQQIFRPNRPPSVVPLMLSLTAIVVVALVAWLVTSIKRLDLDRSSTSVAATGKAGAVAPTNVAAQPGAETTAAGASQPASDASQASENTAVPPSDATPADSTHAAAPEANVSGATQPQMQAAAPAVPEPVAEAPQAPSMGSVNELVVEPLKTTWVKIREGAEDAPPVFEGYIYPRARPLKLRGARFFVEVRDETAVQIRKNGNPIAYQVPGISVQ